MPEGPHRVEELQNAVANAVDDKTMRLPMATPNRRRNENEVEREAVMCDASIGGFGNDTTSGGGNGGNGYRCTH